MRSTMTLSLKRLRKFGYHAEQVERWIPFVKKNAANMSGVRKDMFGLFDIIAFHSGRMGCLAIQTTSASNIAVHTKRYLDDPDRRFHKVLHDWFLCGNRFEVWGWALKGARGKRKLLVPNDWQFSIIKGEFFFIDGSELPDHV